MELYKNTQPKPRRELHVFYVLDTSGSMRGSAISTLNRAVNNCLTVLKREAHDNGDAKIKISVLEFNSMCHWMQPDGPELVDDFLWTNLTAGGLTSMGAAIRELNSKLSRDGWLRSSTGLYMPILIFMTDGFANDDYKAAVDEAMDNDLFSKAIRIGFAIGDDPDFQMLECVTGSAGSVIRTTDLDLFAELLKFVTERSSTVSITPGAGGFNLGDEIVREAWEHVGGRPSSVAASTGRTVGNTMGSETAQGSVFSHAAHSWDIPEV